ncbi:hypothetical protein HQ531_11520 [bacterium]|nr:hypothetical protein [bacterium]
MFSISERAKTRLLEAKEELADHDGSVIRLGPSSKQEGAFKLYIDEVHPDDHKIYGDDNKLILVIKNPLLFKLEKAGLDYDKQFIFVSKK